MFHKVTEIVGDTLAAIDGPLGRIEDVYFDDLDWGLRYLVVSTSGWLGGRKVLISPMALDVEHSTESAIAVNLTREQVRSSPSIDSDMPVSRQYEEIYARYYGYPFYWADPLTPTPLVPATSTTVTAEEAAEVAHAERRAASSHLRSSGEVIGDTIRAQDGPIGRVDDMMIRDDDWSVVDLVVDTGRWLPGRKVLVPCDTVSRIDWKGSEISVRLRRDEIRSRRAAS